MKYQDIPYLKHILDAINDIEGSLSNLYEEEFRKNKDIKDAIIRRLEIIGEAAKNVSKEIKKRYPKVEWAKISGTRDRIIHAYFNVDLGIVWNIVKKDIP